MKGKNSNYNTKLLVIAAGAWSKELLSSIGIRVPLIVERGYHIHCANLGIDVMNSVVYPEGGVIVSFNGRRSKNSRASGIWTN